MHRLHRRSVIFMFTSMEQKPSATAEITGAKDYQTICGKVDFYDTYGGSILIVEIYGIPQELEKMSRGFYGLHIHSRELPPVLSNQGVAWAAVYTSRFYPEDVIGERVILHSGPDDFWAQPSKEPGEKIACGEIRAASTDDFFERQTLPDPGKHIIMDV